VAVALISVGKKAVYRHGAGATQHDLGSSHGD